MSFHILAACCEWELFPFIAEGGESGRTHKEIAAHLKLPAHSLRVLLLACCAYGLLRKDPQSGRYLNTLKMDQSYELLRLQLRYAEQVVQPAFKFLRESLQSGTNKGVETLPGPGATVYERLANSPELEAAFHARMAAVAEKQRMPFLVKVLEDWGNPITHLLDVGGGEGATAHVLNQHFPQMKVTVFDLPSVCQRADENIRQWGKTDQIFTCPGDMFSDPFPSVINGVLFAALLTIFSEEQNRLLLQKAYNALPPKGCVLIHTLTSNEDETGPLNAANMSLYFTILASGGGMAYPVSDYQAWLRDAGFSTIDVIRNPRHEMVVVLIATK